MNLAHNKAQWNVYIIMTAKVGKEVGIIIKFEKYFDAKVKKKNRTRFQGATLF
jgi:hypothetical protein